MSSPETESELSPIEKGLLALEQEEKHKQTCEDQEVVDYLMYTIRLAKKKTLSKKLPDVVKVKWVKAGVDASKALLFSGTLDKRTKREVSTFEALFLSVTKEKMNNIDHSTDDQDRIEIE